METTNFFGGHVYENIRKYKVLPLKEDIYLLLAEFSVRTVNYGSSFFSIDLWPKRERAWAINRWKKRGSVIYSTDRKNEANKMFIIWLLSVWATENKCKAVVLYTFWFIQVEVLA